MLLAALLRFWRLGRLVLIGDEACAWLWSRHLDWSYYDNPSATVWIVYWSTFVGGSAELGVRWLNALPGVVDVALIYGIGKTLFSRRAGAISEALMAAAALCILTSRFVYTDGATFALLLANMLLFLPVLVQASDPVPWWRWLSWIALWLLAPVLISPADSPRNLLLGTIPLLGVSGDFINSRVRN